MPIDDTSRQRIARLIADYHRQIETIRADTNLSPIGRQRAIARAHVNVRRQINQVRAQADRAYRQRRSYLEAELFGVHGYSDPVAAMSLRDAMARVSGITSPAEASRMMRQAMRAGDELLARALASHAYDRLGGPTHDGWQAILYDYGQTQDERRRGLFEELDTLRRADTTESRFYEAAMCSPATPPELAGVGNVEALAEASPYADGGEAAEGGDAA